MQYVAPVAQEEVIDVKEAGADEDSSVDIAHPAPVQKKMIRGVLVEDDATSNIIDITQLKKYYNKKSKNMAPYQQFRESLLQRSQSSYMDDEQPS